MSDRPNSELSTKVLTMAYTIRFKPTGVLFYSDQASLTPVAPLLMLLPDVI
ncbi:MULTISPECIES: hypothetical protein [Moraxella]|uniref:Uncharacterized protein n=1 Tax=Moraxella catarrhalis TaxID=480 RepID=A0A7Z0UWM2_MORCA|nr:hypothetical protein [Moraxella catarrhalis]OAU99152.1 hypothetical protein AO382_2174 [Moraxella catarrhalis]